MTLPIEPKTLCSRRDCVLVIAASAEAGAVLAQLRALGDSAPEIAGLVLPDRSLGRGIDGLTILGDASDLASICAQHRPTMAIVSIPGAMSDLIGRVREGLRSAGVQERFLPTIGDVLADTSSGVRGGPAALDFAALVGRSPRRLDEARVRGLLSGKRVLITGAGGSIGSELARRCAAADAGELILMERSENALFEINRQVGAMFPSLARKAVLHDVVEADATLRRFVALRPQVVFHAAAHKHVPMMEDHPSAAVNNNLFGTKSVADASLAVNAERFVMISTDKAVNPTSVMGATKRLAEVYVRSLNDLPRSSTRCSLVRFGNVLGSACSVLPIWSAQIAEGGPVTLTHMEMTRYFMTIPEAASLVIEAATIDDPRTDVLVLDMGAPVRIRDLAERFVRAHALIPEWAGDADAPANAIRMVVTGIRPGEKLHEELSYSAEELQPTPVPGVMMWAGSRPAPDRITRMVAEMSGVRQADTPSLVIEAIQRHLAHLHEAPTGDFVEAAA